MPGAGRDADPRDDAAQPAEVFAEHELPLLLPARQAVPGPAWSEAKVQRDFHVRAQNAFYSVPYGLIGQQVTVRADDALVKVYHRGQVVKTHPRQPAGGRSSDAADFPPAPTSTPAATWTGSRAMAAARGEAIGIYAARILDTTCLDEDARRLRADRPLPHVRERRRSSRRARRRWSWT